MSAALQRFVGRVQSVVGGDAAEPEVLQVVKDAMRDLVANDDWLPEHMAKPHPQFYRQYLLHLDPQRRFSVVSFVWGPGQETPIHDHTVWGVIGVLRGAENSQAYAHTPDALSQRGPVEVLEPGAVCAVSPSTGDIHQVSNVYDDRVSISIHAYGADIGAVTRHVFDLETGAVKEFVSGYSNPLEAA